MRKLAVVALVSGCLLGGCRWKGAESFLVNTTPQPPIGKAEWPGDPYAKGGVADGSGGRITKTHYGEGAKTDSTVPLVASYDQPAKGSGQQPGELTNEAAAGFGHVNGPGMQASPSEANSLSIRGG